MPSYRFFALCLLLTMMFVLSAVKPVYAQVVPGEPRYVAYEYIREPGIFPGSFYNYFVAVSKPISGIPLEIGRLFDNGENCGNAAHKTKYDSSGNLNSSSSTRFFKHIHIDYSYPISGDGYDVDTGLLIFSVSVTESNVKAYWDYVFPSPGAVYSGGAGVDPTYNCWAYAFGYDIWVEDPTRIYNNDYDQTIWAVVGGVQKYPNHAKKVTSVISNGSIITGTIEKNRSSGIYSGAWHYNYAYPGGSSYKKKP